MWLVDKDRRTVLHWCAIWGLPVHVEISQRINDCVALTSYQDDNGETVLHLAAKFGNSDLVKKMLQSGADKDLKDNARRTAGQVAMEHGWVGLANVLGYEKSNPSELVFSADFLAELGTAAEIHDACQRGGVQVFMDQEFPCNLHSLLGELQDGQTIPANGANLLMKDVEWLRPKQFAGNKAPLLFATDTSSTGKKAIFDLGPGFIGHPMLAEFINTNSSMIQSCFTSRQTRASGVYEVNVPVGDVGVKTILVNDFIPCLNGSPILVRNSGVEFWVPLYLKALAKVAGSYQKLLDGHFDQQMLNTMRRACGIPSWVTATQTDAGSAYFWDGWCSSVRFPVPAAEDPNELATEVQTTTWLNLALRLGAQTPSGSFHIKQQMIHREVAQRYTASAARSQFWHASKQTHGNLLEPGLVVVPGDDAVLTFHASGLNGQVDSGLTLVSVPLTAAEVQLFREGANPTLQRLAHAAELTEVDLECNPGTRIAVAEVSTLGEHGCHLIQAVFRHDDPVDIQLSVYVDKKFGVSLAKMNMDALGSSMLTMSLKPKRSAVGSVWDEIL